MTLRLPALTVLASALCTTTTLAQTSFPEIEPNATKAEATSVVGITAGDAITGTSTGTTTTAANTAVTSVDTFRVKTAALPLGIYRHRLTLTTSTGGNFGQIQGLNQTGTVGVGGTPGTVDSAIQYSSTVTTPADFNQWYGFGKQEELYYRVEGMASSTAPYAAILSTSPVSVTVLPQAFESSSSITITTIGQTTSDTDIHVYDASLNAMPGFDNDDEGPSGGTTQSRIIRTFVPGTYFLAVGLYDTSWNLAAPVDEDFVIGNLMDFPNVLVCSSTSPTTVSGDRNFRIVAANGTWNQANAVSAPDSFSVQWFQFTVAAGAPPIVSPPPANDNCGSATALYAGSATITGDMLGATNDGLATCDSGGAASRDVWYSWTNVFGAPRLLTVSTCGTSGLNDTVLSVLGSCGGTELACNDDNGACTAQPLSSLITALPISNGQTVLIRVSDKALGGAGNFTLTTTIDTPPPPNDSCTSPIALPGPGVYPFDTTSATTAQGGTGSCGGSVAQNTWYTYAATTTGTLTVSTCGQVSPASGSEDTEIWIYSGTACPAGAALACNDDAGSTGCPVSSLNSIVSAPTTCGTVYLLEVGNYTFSTADIFGTFTVTETGTPCSTPSTPFCEGSSVGTSCLGCGNNGTSGHGCGNSSFAGGGLLVNGGISSVSADTMTLTASDVTGPGLFFQATGLAGSPITFGDGMLCAAVGITRMGVVFPAAGVATYPGGLTPAPIGTFGATSGATLHYQCWYRDAIAFCTAATFNLTNGLSVTWTP